MRVRIIKNAPQTSDGLSIERYIGNIYPAVYMSDSKNISVDFGSIGMMIVYEGEYEVIDITRDLNRFVDSCYPYTGDIQEIKDFILANREALVKILQ